MWKFLTTSRFLMDQANPDGAAGGTGGTGGLLGGEAGGGTANPPAGGTATPPAGGGQTVEGWRATIPSELQEDATLKTFKDVTALAAAHVALKKHLGSEKLVVPGKHATPEDWKAVHLKLGLPEKAEDYKITFKPEATITEEFNKDFHAKLYSLGVLPSQAQALADWVSDNNMAAQGKFMESRKTQQAAELADLKKEWGDAYGANLARANKLYLEMADDATKKYFTDSGLVGDTRVIRLLSKAADALYKEDKINDSGIKVNAPADARKAAMAIVTDQNHAYNQKSHPNHAAAVKEVNELFQQAASQG